MSEEVKRIGRDLAYEGTVIKVYKDHMKFANGNTAEWDFIHHDGAAAVVPVMDDGKILMVTQYRNALEIRLKSRQGNWMRRESLELNALPENWRRRRDIVQRILNG